MELPIEDGVIEFHQNGNVTVAGHRVRLKTVYDAIRDGEELNSRFPTIPSTLMESVRLYIARNFGAVSQHAIDEDEKFREVCREIGVSDER